MTFVRSLLAVALGFGVFAGAMVLATSALGSAGDFQMGFFMAYLAAVVVAALGAGFATGWVAGRFEIAHAAVVGLALIVAAFAAMRARGALTPGPYEMTTAGCGPISALLGAGVAMLRRLRRQR